MSGVLYIVATPIGNLDDITLRAIQTLERVDLVAAEDTRHSKQLMAHFGIQKPMISVHEHNEHERVRSIIEKLREGDNIALVSDAGTPLISDPGFPLVRAVTESGLRVVPIPGVSSVITALSGAGLATDQFSFHGFIPHKNAQRLKCLQAIIQSRGTQVFFESTHRIERLLQQLDQLAPDVQIVLAKELTKRHENFIRGNATACMQTLTADPALKKGEFVVLIEGNRDAESHVPALNSENLLKELLQEMPLKNAVKLAVKLTGGKKNTLYQMALEISNKQDKVAG